MRCARVLTGGAAAESTAGTAESLAGRHVRTGGPAHLPNRLQSCGFVSPGGGGNGSMMAPRGRSSVGRASASQAEGRGFDPRRPLREKPRNTGLFFAAWPLHIASTWWGAGRVYPPDFLRRGHASCQLPPRRSGTASPPAWRPSTSTSSLPIIRSVWTWARLTPMPRSSSSERPSGRSSKAPRMEAP